MSWVSRLSCLGLPAFCVVLKPRGSQVSPIFEPWVPPGGFFQKEFDISESPAGNCPRRMIEAPRTEFVVMESRCIFRGFRDSSGSRLLSRMPRLDGPALFPFRYRSGRLNCFLRRGVRAIQTASPSENMSAPTSPISVRKVATIWDHPRGTLRPRLLAEPVPSPRQKPAYPRARGRGPHEPPPFPSLAS